MLTQIAKRVATGRIAKRVPLFKVVAVAQVALLARKHVQNLEPGEARRIADLVRRSRHLTEPEKEELRTLTAKLEPRAFAGAAVDQLSPFPLPRKLTGVAPKRR